MSFLIRRIHSAFFIGTFLHTTRDSLLSTRTFLLSRRTFESSTSKKPRAKFKNVIDEFVKVRDLREMVDQFKSLSSDFRFRERPAIYHETVRRLAVAKKFSWIEEILEDQKQYPCIANQNFIGRIMSLYGKSGMFDQARKLFDEIPHFKGKRTVQSMNSLLYAGIVSKNYHQTVELFHELPGKLKIKRNLISYNTVCMAYLELGSYDAVPKMVEEMERILIKPDSSTYGILLDGLYRDDKVSEAEDVWKAMETKGIRPCIKCYNSKLRYYVSQGNMDAAVYLYERVLSSKEILPDRLTFYLMFKLYRDAKNLKAAKELYATLPTVRGNTADSKIYETLIFFGTEMGDWEFALELSLMGISRVISLPKELLQGVVFLLVEKSKPEQAKQLVESIRESSNVYRYRLMLPLKEELLKLGSF